MLKATSKYQDTLLFALCSLIWGTTWLVIKFQISATTPIVGVFYRFLLASIVMFALNAQFLKKSIRFPLKTHFQFFLQGLFNFSINYILTYMAEEKINSALVALTFTTLIYFNLLGMKIWFKKPISKNVFFGGSIGAIGIFLLFWKEIIHFNLHSTSIFGIFIGLIATMFASSGNMIAFINHQQKIPVIVFNAYGMLYGSLASFIFGILFHQNFALPTSSSFLFSLLYLALFGSVIAFWAYQTLVGTIGADKAAYSSIIAPMIAVIVSAVFEKTQITFIIFLGIIFCLIGNFMALKKDPLFKARK